MLGKPVPCSELSPCTSVSLFSLGAPRHDPSPLCRPSTASGRQRSPAGQRPARPSCSACSQLPLTLARPCCPGCMCSTWNLGATSSHTWTVSRWAEASLWEFPAGGRQARPEPDPPPCCLFQFCGATIAGLSLLSPSVMRLVHTQEPEQWLELLLEPGSLYVLRCLQPEPLPSSIVSLAFTARTTITPGRAWGAARGLEPWSA